MTLEGIGFAVVTLSLGFLIMNYGHGLAAQLALIALAIGVMVIGTHVFGRDWYNEGFIAGLIFGDFYGTVATREEREKKRT